MVNFWCLSDGGKKAGKTLSVAFVEISSKDLFITLSYSREFLRGRMITIRKSSEDELLRHLFPLASPNMGIWLTRDEINGIIMVCKNYRVHYSRKTANRPFELIISIIKKIKWGNCSVLQRDHIFEMIKIAIETLEDHLSKGNSHFTPNLLQRLLKCAFECPKFTDKQKNSLTCVSHVNPEKIIKKYSPLCVNNDIQENKCRKGWKLPPSEPLQLSNSFSPFEQVEEKIKKLELSIFSMNFG